MSMNESKINGPHLYNFSISDFAGQCQMTKCTISSLCWCKDPRVQLSFWSQWNLDPGCRFTPFIVNGFLTWFLQNGEEEVIPAFPLQRREWFAMKATLPRSYRLKDSINFEPLAVHKARHTPCSKSRKANINIKLHQPLLYMNPAVLFFFETRVISIIPFSYKRIKFTFIGISSLVFC